MVASTPEVGGSLVLTLLGSIAVAGGIALVEPCVNAVAFYFHEKVWNRALAKPAG